MKYSVINGPRGVIVQATMGREEGQETPRGIVVWNNYDTRENAERAATRLRNQQAEIEARSK